MCRLVTGCHRARYAGATGGPDDATLHRFGTGRAAWPTAAALTGKMDPNPGYWRGRTTTIPPIVNGFGRFSTFEPSRDYRDGVRIIIPLLEPVSIFPHVLGKAACDSDAFGRFSIEPGSTLVTAAPGADVHRCGNATSVGSVALEIKITYHDTQ